MTLYLIHHRTTLLGRHVESYSATDDSERKLIEDIKDGQYGEPLKILEIDDTSRWQTLCNDATEDIAIKFHNLIKHDPTYDIREHQEQLEFLQEQGVVRLGIAAE